MLDKLRELWAKLDRTQQTLRFKVVASITLATIALGLAVFTLIKDPVVAPIEGQTSAQSASPEAGKNEAKNDGKPEENAGPNAGTASAAASAEAGKTSVRPSEETVDAVQEIIGSMVKQRSDPTAIYVGIASGLGIALAIVWIGLALTALVLGIVVGLTFGGAWFIPALKGIVPVVAGIAALAATMAALMRVAALLLGLSHPVFSIARNTLTEATRQKVSLVFIVLLVFALAGLPYLLDADQPLRYRIQTFMQFGTGGSFWIIALLVVLFSVSSVAFEQRDKLIWQTMTKPVSAWKYVLGKWLGVVTLAAVLITVSSTGVFLFTEYLRLKPAVGEREAYSRDEAGMISEDRLVLETQVLTARESVTALPPEVDEEQFNKNVIARVEIELRELERISQETGRKIIAEKREELIAKIRGDLRKSIDQQYRYLSGIDEAGNPASQYYVFEGLSAAKEQKRPLVFRYKINTLDNRPDETAKVSFIFLNANSTVPEVRETPVNQYVTIPLVPDVIDEKGAVVVQIINGELTNRGAIGNPQSIQFPPDGLEISFSSGSFRANFFRVVVVFWIKLAFLAMIGVFCATFMSFPVACLVSFTVFFAAEGANFLTASLEVFWTEDIQGNTLYFNTAIAKVAEVIAAFFKTYADLKPTERLVDGLRLGWGQLLSGMGVLAVWTLILFVAATLIFRRRELAVYSGNQ